MLDLRLKLCFIRVMLTTDKIISRSIPEPNTGCWLWLGTAFRAPVDMRPFIVINGVRLPAHRVSLEAFKGPIPVGAYACHTCHNSLCVNPDHLYAGTAKQNTQDMMRAGRHFSQCNPAALEALKSRLAKIARARARSPVCKQGHVLAGHNLVINSVGGRACRTCRRALQRGYAKIKRAKLAEQKHA